MHADVIQPQVFQTVTSVTPLTVGETIEKHLCRDRIKLFTEESILWEKAIECFEKEEDAEKGIQITVVGGKKTVSVEQRKPLLKKPSKSSLYTPVNTSTLTRMVLLPTPDMIPLELPKTPPSSPSGAKRDATENEMPQVFPMFTYSPAEDAEPMEIGAMGAEVAEPIEVGTLSEGPRPRRGIKTVGENIEKHLDQDRIHLLEKEMHVPHKCTVLLITNLPEYQDGCYTEEDLAQLLMPFGFKYAADSIYVVPQTCMAFFSVPQFRIRHKIMEASAMNGIFFKSSKLAFHAVASRISMTPFGFYKSLMQLMRFRVLDDGEKIVFINNISLSESRELREVLKRIKFVKNFLPLLNKVFVEFKSTRDADWFGVWLLKQSPDRKVHRLNIPSIGQKLPLPPKLPENALPDSKDVVASAALPPIDISVPQGSIGPFWIPMRTHPFLFPTGSPCFVIPDYLTVRGQDDIAEASGRGSRFPTIMLTGLPVENYNHEDVAKLVWRYFPKRNLRSLYYNVAILPLQRRAFVFFADWTSCCDFVQDHIRNPVCVEFCPLSVHFVLEDMSPGSSEETMYTTLMKWSNAGDPEPKLLEERLLCVETSEMSLDIIGVVMGAVASIAPFVGFLPLSNRICIEMADPSGVTKVVEHQHKRRILYRIKNIDIWSEVQSFEP